MLLGGIGVAFAATNGQRGTADPDISKDEATEIAEEHVGTTKNAQVEQENGPRLGSGRRGRLGAEKEVIVARSSK